MGQSKTSFGKQARFFFFNFFRQSLLRSFLIAYSVVSIPFFVYHEFHLPFHYIFILTLLTWIVGVSLLVASALLLQSYWKNPFHPLIEMISVSFFILALWLSEVFLFRAGRVFLFMLSSLLFFVRFLKIETFAKLALAGLLISGNGIITFRAMQGFEILASYILYKNKYPFPETKANEWVQKENGFYWNPAISIGFTLPEEGYFFRPEDLGLADKTGIGQLAGVIGSSDSDPNRYPSVRIFFLPSFIKFSKEEADREMFEYLKTKVSKQEIEDLQEITVKEEIFENVGYRFWTFYDSLRPRFAKTGYILVETPNSDSVLLQITENLEKGKDHEPWMESLLGSIRFSDPFQGND